MRMSLRKEVLSLYRKILRLSLKWEALDPNNTQKERKYIADEAKRLFRENKNIENEEEIKKKLREGCDRVEIAKHYGIPYPRLSHFPTGSFAKR